MPNFLRLICIFIRYVLQNLFESLFFIQLWRCFTSNSNFFASIPANATSVVRVCNCEICPFVYSNNNIHKKWIVCECPKTKATSGEIRRWLSTAKRGMLKHKQHARIERTGHIKTSDSTPKQYQTRAVASRTFAGFRYSCLRCQRGIRLASRIVEDILLQRARG